MPPSPRHRACRHSRTLGSLSPGTHVRMLHLFSPGCREQALPLSPRWSPACSHWLSPGPHAVPTRSALAGSPWDSEGPQHTAPSCRELVCPGFREIPLCRAQHTLAALNLTCSFPSKLLVPCNCLNFGSINVQAVKIELVAKRPI